MRSKRTVLAKGLDYIAICLCAYFISMVFFMWLGVKGIALPLISLVLAALLLALLALTKRRLKRYPGKAARDAALRNEWITRLLLMTPGECIETLFPLLASRYALTDAEMRLGSGLPYAVCVLGKERIAVACAKIADIETVSSLASIAIAESVENAVLCSLTQAREELITGLPLPITVYGPDRIKSLMPTDFEGFKARKAKDKKNFFLSKLARETFAKQKATRYTLYGFGLVMLYFLMGFSYALLPGVACLILAIVSRAWPEPKDMLI